MMFEANTAEVLERGMECLLEKLGTIETERFISIIIRERFDYTKWRKNLFGDVSLEEINKAAAQFASAHPLQLKKQQVKIG